MSLEACSLLQRLFALAALLPLLLFYYYYYAALDALLLFLLHYYYQYTALAASLLLLLHYWMRNTHRGPDQREISGRDEAARSRIWLRLGGSMTGSARVTGAACTLCFLLGICCSCNKTQLYPAALPCA